MESSENADKAFQRHQGSDLEDPYALFTYYRPNFPRFTDEFHEKVNVINTCCCTTKIVIAYVKIKEKDDPTKIVIAYVKIKEKDDPRALENQTYEPSISDSGDDNEDYGSKDKSLEKSPENILLTVLDLDPNTSVAASTHRFLNYIT
ncbi:hypothetical protein POM88_026933 [Heracleum sosnowskyi]|uniref:Uncharacterized protein n=1 Tax=Heracleum sosnowskyi TaxID=360622 RepID=A0AAD8I811_9APIA|nr:hypothetical protein POM88_026933 [Heracleum sosnowskyi]